MKIKEKFSVGKFFYNNKFAIAFSLIVSFCIWVMVSSSSYEKQEKVISDIPIVIPLSDDAQEMGLKVFSGADTKAEIKVSGNRVTLGMLAKDNIQIIAKQAANSIISPGTYTLELSANKKGSLTDYEFESSVSPRFITVTVDKLRKVSFNVENEIKYNSDPAYFAATPNFSESNVTISGPESKITTISKVAVKKDIEGTLNSTLDLTLPLIVYDQYGMDISKDPLIEMSFKEIAVTIPVLYKKKVNVLPDILNLPENLKSSTSFATVEPNQIEIAGPENVTKDLSEVKLSSLDISKINTQNQSFKLDINLPNGCRTMNNIYSATLKINMDRFKTRKVAVKHFSFVNTPEGKTPKVYTNEISVEMVGPNSDLNNLDSDDVLAEIDLKDQSSDTGGKELPVRIRTKSNSSCWAYGSYTANVSIE